LDKVISIFMKEVNFARGETTREMEREGKTGRSEWVI
jgi:hypothetical protein